MQLQSLRSQTKQTAENKHQKYKQLTCWCKVLADKQQRTGVKINFLKLIALRASDVY